MKAGPATILSPSSRDENPIKQKPILYRSWFLTAFPAWSSNFT